MANGGTILIVDDTPANLAFLSDALDEAGYKVLVALDGRGAIDQLQLMAPDLILLDVMMPGIDGFETCRRLKSMRNTCDIPIIFMTALNETADVVRGFGAGAVDYVTKPLRHQEVLARIATRLRCARTIKQFENAAEQFENAAEVGDDTRMPGIDELAQLFGLTQREAEVLLWAARGKTNRDIGQILGTSPRTVNKHLEHIYIKLGVETRTAAANKVREKVPVASPGGVANMKN